MGVCLTPSTAGRWVAFAAVCLGLGPVGAHAAASRCEGAGAPTRSVAWRAYVSVSTPVRPQATSPVSHARTVGFARWMLVVGATGERDGSCRLEVRLGGRPNTAHGWVLASRVALRPTAWRIEISRARGTATLLHSGRRVGRWRVVVGKPSTPTPAGLFAIGDSFRSPPTSFDGAWIVTLSAHSDVLDRFEGGDGQVALHGRGGASLADRLGSAASHGCIRFANHAIDSIVRRIGRSSLPGVPVAIT
jgi:hypothetical protein